MWAQARREVTAVDGPDGLFLADPTADVLQPISTTAAYRIFSTVLTFGALSPASS